VIRQAVIAIKALTLGGKIGEIILKTTKAAEINETTARESVIAMDNMLISVQRAWEA